MRTMLVTVGLVLAAAASVIACGDDRQAPATQTPAPVPTQPAPVQTSTGTTPAPTQTTHVDAPPPPKPDAPVLDTIKAQPDGIKLAWDPVSCDHVVGQRKDGLNPYTQVFSVAGTEGSYVDTSIAKIPFNDSTQFTYRLVCEKAGMNSDWSNELSSTGYAAAIQE